MVVPEAASPREHGEESADELIAAADAAGFGPVTKDQLARWHRVDLLPRPRQVSRGRAGSEVLYPAHTLDQLLALLALKKHNRKLATIRWGLWWMGHPIPDHRAREFLEDRIRANVKTMDELAGPDGKLTNKAEDALDRMPTAEVDTGGMRRARRRVRTEEFDFFMQDLLLISSGNLDMVKNEDLERLERGMALDRARTDKVASLGAPWLTTDVRDDFENIAKHVDFGGQLATLAATSDDELRAARDNAKIFMPVISNVGSVFLRRSIQAHLATRRSAGSPTSSARHPMGRRTSSSPSCLSPRPATTRASRARLPSRTKPPCFQFSSRSSPPCEKRCLSWRGSSRTSGSERLRRTRRRARSSPRTSRQHAPSWPMKWTPSSLGTPSTTSTCAKRRSQSAHAGSRCSRGISVLPAPDSGSVNDMEAYDDLSSAEQAEMRRPVVERVRREDRSTRFRL